MNNVAILSAVRTPIGKALKGTLKDTRPDTFGGIAVKEAVKRAGIKSEQVEDLIMGCAMPEAEQGMNVARIVGFLADLPHTTSAATVNRFCSSGLHAIADVAKAIQIGQYDVGIGGGVESMSMVPMGGHKPSANPLLMDSKPEVYTPMGITAENVAKQFDISRKDQDEFSVESHKRAVAAAEKGWFKNETVTFDVDIFDAGGKKTTINFAKDDGPRKETSFEVLSKLRTVFDTKGTVTAGNASQISDGAAASVLMNADLAKKRNLKPVGFFRSFVTAGVPPEIMGIGPVPAIEKLLKLNGLKKDDIGAFEINEAFAAQVVYCIHKLELDPEIVNPCGGAVALGHPLGCTGARQVATILSHMKRVQAKYGVIAMCVGGGMGAAGLVELS